MNGANTMDPKASAIDRDEHGFAPAARGSNKFAYAGGARPLEGYTIKRGVGQGGFGEIYYALSDAGKEVALKLIRRNLDVELRGIRHCLNLKHPNLLNLFDIRQDANGDTWVVMEFVNGMSLQDVLDSRPNGLPIEEALAWIHGIGAAVSYLHEHGIVHRDLKPGNIFLDEGVVKVGDYGLSKFISCSRRSGHTESIGTVHYMAPEVANGRYGREIDIYALGVVLYELLTGEVPFDGESIGEVLMKHLTAQPDVSRLSEPMRSVVAKALEKDPEKRFHTVSEMLAELPKSTTGLPNEVVAQYATGSAGFSGNYSKETPSAAVPHRAFAETVAVGKETDEEPIAKAIKQWWNERDAWNKANVPPIVKASIIVGIIFGAIITFETTGPLLIGLAVAYGVYRFIRFLVLESKKSSAAATVASSPPPAQVYARSGNAAAYPEAAPAAPGATPVWDAASRGQDSDAHSVDRKKNRRKWRDKPAVTMLWRSPRERTAELLGSLLLSTFIVGVMTVLFSLFLGFNNIDPTAAQLGWFTLTTLSLSWSVLIVTKFWEGTEGDAWRRRFVLLVVGMAIGAASYGLHAWFMPNLTGMPSQDGYLPDLLTHNYYNYKYQPFFFTQVGDLKHTLFLVNFGAMLFLVRWWRQANPIRRVRFSFWITAVATVLAAVISSFTQFPQPWLPAITLAASIAIQISSPWIDPKTYSQS